MVDSGPVFTISELDHLTSLPPETCSDLFFLLSLRHLSGSLKVEIFAFFFLKISFKKNHPIRKLFFRADFMLRNEDTLTGISEK